MEKPDLKELQALAENMEKGVGFKPPLDYLEKDGEKLLQSITANAADLDPNLDRDVITDASKKTLRKLGIGPWLNEKPEADKKPEARKQEPEREKEQPAAKQEATPPSQEKPAKPENPKQEKEKGMKKQTTKKQAEKAKTAATAAKKQPAKKAEGTQKNRGIGEWITAQLKKNKGVANAELAAAARDKFPGAKTSPACISWYRSRL